MYITWVQYTHLIRHQYTMEYDKVMTNLYCIPYTHLMYYIYGIIHPPNLHNVWVSNLTISKTGVYCILEVVYLGMCTTSDQHLVILPPHDYNLYFTCYVLMSEGLHIVCSLNIVQQEYILCSLNIFQQHYNIYIFTW